MNHVICDLLDLHVMFQLVETLRINYFVNMMNIKNCYVILCVIILVLLFCILINEMCTKICQLLKVFNDTTNTLSDVYYLTTNLFIIESLSIIGAFDECMSQELKLKTYIDVMKSKWLDYYANIPIIYLIGIIFYLRCKLDFLTMCLENNYSFLDLEVDVDSIVSNIKSMFYSLYDEYVKFYGLNLNINIQ